jgi:hypothetical protein
MAGIDMQNAKIVQLLRPIDATGATLTDVEVDCKGYDYLTVIVSTGNVAANMTTLKLQESDASGSGEADFTGSAFTAPTATGDNNVIAAFIDLRKRKRYISTVATGGAGATLISAVGILTRAEVTPTSATERGLNEQLIL